MNHEDDNNLGDVSIESPITVIFGASAVSRTRRNGAIAVAGVMMKTWSVLRVFPE